MKLEIKIKEEDWEDEHMANDGIQRLMKYPEGVSRDTVMKMLSEQNPEYCTAEGKIKPNDKTGYFYGYGYIIFTPYGFDVETIGKDIFRTKSLIMRILIHDYTRALEKTAEKGEVSI